MSWKFDASALVGNAQPATYLTRDPLVCQVGKVGKWSKNDKNIKVLRMKFSIVENVPTPRESIFTLSRASQLPYSEQNKTYQGERRYFFIYTIFLYFHLKGPPIELSTGRPMYFALITAIMGAQ